MDKNCELCGGRVINGRCSLCGMDYTRRTRRYKLNQENERKAQMDRKSNPPKSATPNRPAAHNRPVATNRPTAPNRPIAPNRPVAPSRPATPNRPRTARAEQNKNEKSLRMIIMVAALAVAIGVSVYTMIAEKEVVVETSDERAQDRYAYTTAELAETGEEYQVELEAGQYIVGKHLPEGNYTLKATEQDSWVTVDDVENNIYFNESLSLVEEEYSVREATDIRLFTGAMVLVSSTGTVGFETSTAQLQNMQQPQENPLTEEVVLTQDAVAGEDFEAGTYDVAWVKGQIMVAIMTEEEQYILGAYMTDSEYSMQYLKNIELAKGTTIMNELEDEEFTLKLIPSEKIYE